MLVCVYVCMNVFVHFPCTILLPWCFQVLFFDFAMGHENTLKRLVLINSVIINKELLNGLIQVVYQLNAYIFNENYLNICRHHCLEFISEISINCIIENYIFRLIPPSNFYIFGNFHIIFILYFY